MPAGGKSPDLGGVIMRLDVSAGAGDGDAVEEFKKLEVEGLEDCVRSALLRRELAPTGEGGLSLAEDFFHGVLGSELFA